MRNFNKWFIPALTSALGALVLVPASTVLADTTASLPITSFYQVVVDGAHGHVFISQGSSSVNEILVTNLAGQEVTTVAGQDGVMGIALSPNGGTLYAALGASHAVTAIDTSTLQQTASYPLGDGNTPADVAVQSGKVWVSYNTGPVGSAAVGDIDLSAATPAFETQAAMGGWYAAPELAADPQDTGVLIAAEPSMSPASVASYNVSVDPATVRAQSTFFSNCEEQDDLAVVPGGSEFILACGAPYAHYRYSTADLSQQGSYASTNYPDAVAIDASGDVAAGTANNPANPDVYVYHQGGDTPLNTYNLGASGDSLVARGLAWSADGSRLFAVLQNSDNSTYSLHVIDGPTLIASSLSLTGPATADIAKKVTLTGKLTLSAGAPPPAGTAISIARSVQGATGTKDFTVATTANGSFTLTDTPPALGKYTYTGSYSGTATIGAATATKVVTVTLVRPSLTMTSGPATRGYESTVQIKAHLGTTHSNRTVSIYAQTFGGKATTLLKTGRVNSSGNLTVSRREAHSTTFSVVFSGDADYASRTVTHAVRVRAKVSESQSGYYGSKRVRRTTYRLYHRADLLHVHATVSPDKSRQCVEVEVQEYFEGAWQSNVTTACVKLSKASQISGALNLTQADIGFRYRVRADYVRSTNDISNLSNDSGWQYLMVEP